MLLWLLASTRSKRDRSVCLPQSAPSLSRPYLFAPRKQTYASLQHQTQTYSATCLCRREFRYMFVCVFVQIHIFTHMCTNTRLLYICKRRQTPPPAACSAENTHPPRIQTYRSPTCIHGNQVDTFLAGGVEIMSDVPIRFSRPIRKRLMAASKMKSPGQMLGLLGGLKGADFAPVAPGVAEFSTGEIMGHSADRLCSSEFCRYRLLSVALCVSLRGRAASICMYVCIYIHKFICMHMHVYLHTHIF